MKFTLALSALLLASSASAASVSARANNKFGGGRFGNKGGASKGGASNKGGNKGGNNAGAATSTTAAAASASSAAATGNNNGSGNNQGAGNNQGSGNNQGAGNNSTGSGGAGNSGDPQSSLTLLQSVIATGFENTGQDAADNPAAGQVASLTSSNNFINFCATVPQLPITNGKQIKTGSCNPAPMGVIIAQDKMPASKFVFPQNFQAIKANTAFTIQMAIKNLVTGNFVNAQTNYYAAPQQVDNTGTGVGHTHFVVENVASFTATDVLNNVNFAFFQGVNTAAQNGVLSVDVTAGLPTGTYRLASINAAANHQPVLVAVAQHGSLDDMVYFEVTADGQPSSSNPGGAASSGAAASNNSTGNAGNNGGNGGNNGGNGGNSGNAGKGGSNNAGGNATSASTTTAAAAASSSASKGSATSGSGNGSATAGKGSSSAGGKGGVKPPPAPGKNGKGKRFEGFARAGLNRL